MKILAIGDFHSKFPEKLKKLIKKENPDLILSTGDYAGIPELRPALKKMFKANDRGKRIHLSDILGKKKLNYFLKKDYSEGKNPIKELNKFGIPVLSVFGNGDWYKWEFNKTNRDYSLLINKLKNIKNIDKHKLKLFNLCVAGFGGYIDNDVYFSKEYIEKHKDSVEAVKRRTKRYVKCKKVFLNIMKSSPDILLLHYTPYNCLDVMKDKGYYLSGKHMGISFFNEGIKKYFPSLVVCGHMHENQGKCKIGRTLVVNPGAAIDGGAAIIDFDEKEKKVLSVRFVN